MSQEGKKRPREVFDVEKILARRKAQDGGVEFLVKWRGYDESKNSWEPIQHINAYRKLAEFQEEEERRIRELKTDIRKVHFKEHDGIDKKTLTKYCQGKIEKIFGIVDSKCQCHAGHDRNVFLVKWEDESEVDLVKAVYLNKICPDLVIQFYQDQCKDV